MLRGSWLKFVALGLAASVAVLFSAPIYLEAERLQASYESQAAQNAKAYADSAGVHADRNCSVVPKSRIRECVHDQYHAARERQRSEYDLQAQLVTSAWTRAMGMAAIIAMVVGIIGVGLVYVTFRETRRASDTAAETLAHTIKETAKRDRPRLYTVRARMKRHQKQAKVRKISFGIENCGLEAAYNVTGWLALRYYKLPLPIDRGSELEDPIAYPLIRPGGKVWAQKGILLSEQEAASLQRADGVIFAVCIVKYVPIAGGDAETICDERVFYDVATGGTVVVDWMLSEEEKQKYANHAPSPG